MTGQEIANTLGWIPWGGAGVLIAIFLGLIKVKPLEISVWHWIARKLGRAFNGETIDKLNDIEKTLNDHLREEEAKEALQHRQAILTFADEMYERRYHSKENFEEIIERILKYEKYCDEHEDFKNGRTAEASRLIHNQYRECMGRHSFDMKKEDETDGQEIQN